MNKKEILRYLVLGALVSSMAWGVASAAPVNQQVFVKGLEIDTAGNKAEEAVEAGDIDIKDVQAIKVVAQNNNATVDVKGLLNVVLETGAPGSDNTEKSVITIESAPTADDKVAKAIVNMASFELDAAKLDSARNASVIKVKSAPNGVSEVNVSKSLVIKAADISKFAKSLFLAEVAPVPASTQANINLLGDNDIQAEINKTIFEANGKGASVVVGNAKADNQVQNIKGQAIAQNEGKIVVNLVGKEAKAELGATGNGTIDVLAKNGGAWSVAGTEKSTLNTLTLQAEGKVDLTKWNGGALDNALVVKSLEGDNGVLVLKTDLANKKAQVVEITEKSAGTHTVQVQDDTKADKVLAPVKIIDVNATAGLANFKAKFKSDKPVVVGPYKYIVGNYTDAKMHFKSLVRI